MTVSPQPTSPKSSSRRALLAGAIGGLGALAASAIGRASAVRAADGDAVTVGGNFSGLNVTSITNTSTTGTGFSGSANGTGYGVYGSSTSGPGIYGYSGNGQGVWGESINSTQAATVGHANNSGTGVLGYSGNISVPAAKGKTGVQGYANQDGTAYGVYGESSLGTGVYGSSNSKFGVVGTSPSGGVSGTSTNGTGVYGSSGISVGVRAYSNATLAPAAQSWSAGNSTGVLGYSGDSPPAPLANTGVYGMATQDDTARGVVGETTGGHGVHGIATNGYAGYFNGKVFTNKFHEMAETTTPTAPAANKARLFVRDNGSGKTQLCVRFPTGAVQVIKTEP
jgi:hypothetical protein